MPQAGHHQTQDSTAKAECKTAWRLQSPNIGTGVSPVAISRSRSRHSKRWVGSSADFWRFKIQPNLSRVWTAWWTLTDKIYVDRSLSESSARYPQIECHVSIEKLENEPAPWWKLEVHWISQREGQHTGNVGCPEQNVASIDAQGRCGHAGRHLDGHWGQSLPEKGEAIARTAWRSANHCRDICYETS